MRVLGLIPARGGSRGVPGKNTRLLGGRPLLAYTAEAALAAARLDRIVLSTDDDGIAELGRELGLEVPFLRPAELAGDETPMIDVVRHALDTVHAEGDSFDAVCLLQPTSPIRPPGLVDECVETLVRTGADSVTTMVPVAADHNPHWVYERTATGELVLATGEREPISRRQDLPPAWHRDGAVYVTRSAVVSGGSLYGRRLEMVERAVEDSVNIDTPSDWERAESRIAGATT